MLHRFHQASACIIGAYLLVHLINHLLAIHSVEAHMAFMEAFRQLYRRPVVEFVLLGCVLFQGGYGLYFIKNRWGQRHGFFERLQRFQGLTWRISCWFMLRPYCSAESPLHWIQTSTSQQLESMHHCSSCTSCLITSWRWWPFSGMWRVPFFGWRAVVSAVRPGNV